MCGIAGIFRTQSSGDDRSTIESMLAALERRGPDADGLLEEGPITLGHRRLSILDLSDAGRQPMVSASGRYVVSYNGEVYNFRDLRDELGVDPADLRSSSDTEILLLAWEKWGPAALDRMVGQWAFAIYDREERKLWLARDRFGEKPLYYHEGAGALTFASSIAALIQAPWVPRELDEDALVEYLTLRYVVAPRTVLRDVKKLPGGHLLEAGEDGTHVRSWYDPRFKPRREQLRGRSKEDLADEFGSLLVQASKRCLVSDVPVSLLLSDGIDSNSIRYAMREGGRDVSTFTYVMAKDEPGLVPIDSKGFDAPSWDLRVTPRGRLETMDEAFSRFTEPMGDGASLATWLLIRNAREHATVFVCGHGSDEVLGGYRLSQDRFRLQGMRWISYLPTVTLRALFGNKTFGPESPDRRQRRFRRTSLRKVPEAARYLIHRPLPHEDVSQILSQDGVPDTYLDTVARLYDECSDEASALDRIQEVMMRTFLAEDILSFADSVAMDSSAELRLPFLDRDLVEFVWALPDSARVHFWPGRANTKQILRFWGENHIPREIVELRKRNFNYGTIRELLAEDEGRVHDRMLGCAPLRRALPGLETWLQNPHEYFRGPWEGTVWALLSLGIWAEASGVR
ncbi:MAG: asparagine synthase (glutamine-hydrolyzing) [Candidatus Binatia bacterium]|nr:asparagine synthase (glutamine-hydrolyzing) [Candidatus Binatia bacterium]